MASFKQFLLEFNREFVLKMILKSLTGTEPVAIKISKDDFPNGTDSQGYVIEGAEGFIKKVWVGSLDGLFVEYTKQAEDANVPENARLFHVHRSLIPHLKIKTIDGVKTLVMEIK